MDMLCRMDLDSVPQLQEIMCSMLPGAGSYVKFKQINKTRLNFYSNFYS